MSALIEFNEVCKYYQMGDTVVKALDHVTMQIEAGEFVAIVGQSGSGKSTCMNIIGCLDVPTAGSYHLNGRERTEVNILLRDTVTHTVIPHGKHGSFQIGRISRKVLCLHHLVRRPVLIEPLRVKKIMVIVHCRNYI